MGSLNTKLKHLFIARIILDVFILVLLITTNIIAFCILKKISQTEITIVSLFEIGDLFRLSSIWDISIFFISSAFIIYGVVRFSMLLYPVFICSGMCAFYTYTLLKIAYVFISPPSGCIIDIRGIKFGCSLWRLLLFSTIAILCVVFDMWRSRKASSWEKALLTESMSEK
jgi:hypothetical protein